MNILNRTNETNVRKQLLEEIKKYLYVLDTRNEYNNNTQIVRKILFYNQKKPKPTISKNKVRHWERYKIVPLDIVDQCIEKELIPISRRAANIRLWELAEFIVEHEKNKIKRNTKPPQQIIITPKQVISFKNHLCTETTCSNNNHGICSISPYQPVYEDSNITYCKRYKPLDLGSPIVTGAESWWLRKE